MVKKAAKEIREERRAGLRLHAKQFWEVLGCDPDDPEAEADRLKMEERRARFAEEGKMNGRVPVQVS